MKPTLYSITLLALAPISTPLRAADAEVDAPQAPPGVQVVVSEAGLVRESPLEVRFPAPMVPDATVGQTIDAEKVLKIEPPLKGTFIWRSRYSGTFVPAEVPKLGASFTVKLAETLRDSSGAVPPLAAPAKASAPCFRVRQHYPRWFGDPTRQPVITLFFNDSADAKSVQAGAYFVDKAGKKVPVAVAVPLENEVPHGDVPTGSWDQQFSGGGLARHDPKSPIVSAVRITPQQPLPPGENWLLRVDSGLANAEASSKTQAPYVVSYGTVAPMVVRNIDAESPLNEERELHINFSKSLPKELDPAILARHIAVEPMPEQAKWEARGYSAALTGQFEIGATYKVTVKPGLAAVDGLIVEKGLEQAVNFTPHEAEISLPAFDQAQWIGGRRDFEFVVANCAKVDVKIKRVDPQNIVYALRGYDSYQNDPANNSGGYTRIPYPAMPGKTVWEKTFESQVDLDRSERFKFTWEEALGGQIPGVYFVNVEGSTKAEVNENGHIGAQALIQLTDLGLAWKYTNKEAVIFAFSHSTGKPLKDVQLATFDDDSNPLGTQATDANGMATLAMAPKSRWLVAVGQRDWHGVAFHPDMPKLDMWSFDLSYTEDGPDKLWRDTLIFTDRPVYQPGETVYLKAITRAHSGEGLAFHANRQARLKAYDLENRIFLEKEVTFSEQGSYADTIRLPANGVGHYHFEFQFLKPQEAVKNDQNRTTTADANEPAEEEGDAEEGDEGEDGDEENGEDPRVESTVEHYVLVQEYQPNSFRITFDGGQMKQNGEVMGIPLKAAYFMGKALSDAKVKWSSTLAQSRFYPDKFADYEFCHARTYSVYDGESWRQLDREDWHNPMSTGQGEATLGARGDTIIPAKVPTTFGVPGPKILTVESEITDLNQQTIAETFSHTLHSSEFYLGVKRNRNAYYAGQEVPFQIIAVQPDGQRVNGPVKAHLLIERLQWNAVKVQTAGGGSETRHDLTYVREMERDLEVLSTPGRESIATFKPTVAGSYNATMTAKDVAGAEVRTIVSFDVYGGQPGAWAQKDGVAIELTPDKDSYKAGETAKIVVKSPFKGQALISVEREKVRKIWLTEVDGSGGVVEVPVEGGYAPNCFVSVLQIRGGAEDPKDFKMPDYRVGFCELKIESNVNVLTVELLPAKPEVLPGGEVEVVALVKDAADKPVANAEVALWAVDEGILSLVPYERPDPLGTFHYTESLRVNTGISLTNLLPENPEERDYSNKGFVIGGGGEGEDAGKGLRKEFKPLAYWNAALTTGEDGKVTVKFKAPDNLTQFRLLAVVNEGVARFGSGESSFKVNKPLMLEPSLPRFANVGDEVQLKAVLHNTTQFSGEIDVTLKLDDNLEYVAGPGEAPAAQGVVTKTFTVAAGQSRAGLFPVRFAKMGEATFQWSAKAKNGPADLVDAVSSTLSVGTVEPMLRDVSFAALGDEAKPKNLLQAMRPELLDSPGELTLELSNSRLLEAADAIEQLLHYPYGCVEQTTSAMLPWVTLNGGLKNALPQLRRTDEQIREVVQKGVDRLLSMQTSAGGLAYWPKGQEPSLWGSAHGGLGLVLAAKQGAVVPQNRLDALTKYLSRALRDAGDENEPGALVEKCFIAYTLAVAGKAEPAYHEVLFERRAELPTSARAILALAVAESNGPADIANDLLGRQKEEGAKFEWWLGGESENAIRTLAWLKLNNEAKAEASLAKLINLRSPRGDWRNTFNNSWTLLALAEHAKRQKPWQAGEPATVTFNGEAKTLNFEAAPSSQSLSFTTGGGGQMPTLTIKVPAGRKLYARVEAKARAKKGLDQGRSSGFAIARNYQKVDNQGVAKPGEALRVGDLVLVTLNLDVPNDTEYLAIDDPLPSTLEGVNPEFKSMAANPRAGTQNSWWVYDHQEMRRDRVLFFRDFFQGSGRFSLSYLARVTAQGSVSAPPAKIEAMYDPAKFGLSPVEKFTTQAGDDSEVAGK